MADPEPFAWRGNTAAWRRMFRARGGPAHWPLVADVRLLTPGVACALPPPGGPADPDRARTLRRDVAHAVLGDLGRDLDDRHWLGCLTLYVRHHAHLSPGQLDRLRRRPAVLARRGRLLPLALDDDPWAPHVPGPHRARAVAVCLRLSAPDDPARAPAAAWLRARERDLTRTLRTLLCGAPAPPPTPAPTAPAPAGDAPFWDLTLYPSSSSSDDTPKRPLSRGHQKEHECSRGSGSG